MQTNNNGLNENPEVRLTDELTDKRIHEHLTNKYDIITEDDIRNVVTTIGAVPALETVTATVTRTANSSGL